MAKPLLNSTSTVSVDRRVLDEMLEAVLDLLDLQSRGIRGGESRVFRAAYELGIEVHGEHGWKTKMKAFAGSRGAKAMEEALNPGEKE